MAERKSFSKRPSTEIVDKGDFGPLFSALFSSDVADCSCPEDNVELGPCEVQTFIDSLGVEILPVITMLKGAIAVSDPVVDVMKQVEVTTVYSQIDISKSVSQVVLPTIDVAKSVVAVTA